MTQDEQWMERWREVIDFMQENHRRPSKYYPEERDMYNWWKHSKKLLNAGELKEERLALFQQLLSIGEENKHVNQWK